MPQPPLNRTTYANHRLTGIILIGPHIHIDRPVAFTGHVNHEKRSLTLFRLIGHCSRFWLFYEVCFEAFLKIFDPLIWA